MQEPTTKTFPVVSMGKFTTLYFITMGWYALYWFYKCWVAMSTDSERNLFPILRALFAVFFVHELFAYIDKKQSDENRIQWQPSKYAWIFIGIGVLGVVQLVVTDLFKLNSLIGLTIFITLLVMQYYVLYKVQLVINRAGNDPFGASNSKLTLENHLWSAFGVYIWMSSFYTCYLDLTGQLIVPSLFEQQVETDTDTNPLKDLSQP